MNFYTNFERDGAQILLREVCGDRKVNRRVRYSPKLYKVVDQPDGLGFRSIDGRNLSEIEFSDMFSAHQYTKDSPDIYGNTQYEYAFVDEEYPGDSVPFDSKMIDVLALDIEVTSAPGFPNIDEADQEITSVTFYHRGKYTIFGRKDYHNTDPNTTYTKCPEEKDLVDKMLTYWIKVGPDVLTGWYIDQFDIPYIVNRCRKIGLGEKLRKISPWGKIKDVTKQVFGKEQKSYEIVGVAILDGLDLYKRFSPKKRESYSLGYIGQVELGETKQEYDGSLFELYQNDYQTYIDYNKQDVALVVGIDNKMKLIELVFTLAYYCKVNYTDIFGQIKLWDTIVTNYLRSSRKVIPTARKPFTHKDGQNIGGFVKPPVPGMKKWMITFDVASLYPSLMMSLNISPETFAGMIELSEKDVLADRTVKHDPDFTIAANGAKFDHTEVGFIPELIDKLFAERKSAKKEMLQCKSLLDKVNSEIKKRA